MQASASHGEKIPYPGGLRVFMFTLRSAYFLYCAA